MHGGKGEPFSKPRLTCDGNLMLLMIAMTTTTTAAAAAAAAAAGPFRGGKTLVIEA